MEGEVRIINGMVVGRIGATTYLIYCNEAYIKHDGILYGRINDRLELGDYVAMKFTAKDARRYFPMPRNPRAEQFRTTKYELFKKNLYETVVEERTIRVYLELDLERDQAVIEHPEFFGRIRNNKRKSFPAGRHFVTIRRANIGNIPDSVWMIERVETQKFGIVAGKDDDYWYVCSDYRQPGKDIRISLEVGDIDIGYWINMYLPSHLLYIDRLECKNYEVILPVYPTTPTEGENPSIQMSLPCLIHRSDQVEDFSHPMFGRILNNLGSFDSTGIYAITMNRVKPNPDEKPRSVWHLARYEFLTPDINDPRLLQQINAGVDLQPEIPLDPYFKRAMVIKTFPDPEEPGKEKVFVWLFGKHCEGRLYLTRWAADSGLSPGKVFTASFTVNSVEHWTAHEPAHHIGDLYHTRPNTAAGVTQSKIDIKITVKDLQEPDVNHFERPWISHKDFGDVIDNRRQLSVNPNGSNEYVIWIRRAWVNTEDNHQWVVVEQDVP